MTVSPDETANGNNSQPSSELAAARWSVLTFEGCAASGVTYAEAARTVERLSDETQGLCIVTDEAAQKLCAANKTKPDDEIEDLSRRAFQETL